MNIRDIAIHCEAKKHAYRQTQDGVVVSFVLHPQEVPDGLATAALGTRYMLALVAIGDDEQPVAGAGARPAGRSIAIGQRAAQRNPGGEDEVTPGNTHDHDRNAASSDEPAPEKPHKSWHDMMPAQQAGILCNEPAFARFLEEYYPATYRSEAVSNPAECVRIVCGVKSRSHIVPGTTAAGKWKEIAGEYRAWMREPEIVG